MPDVESGSETSERQDQFTKCRKVGVATRIGGRERVEEEKEAGQLSAMAACSGSSVCTSPSRQQRC